MTDAAGLGACVLGTGMLILTERLPWRARCRGDALRRDRAWRAAGAPVAAADVSRLALCVLGLHASAVARAAIERADRLGCGDAVRAIRATALARAPASREQGPGSGSLLRPPGLSARTAPACSPEED